MAGSGHFTMTELCRDFGISRKTGHKWVTRHAAGGIKALEERSRAPISVSCRTSDEIERLICTEKRHRPTWGPKKIQRILTTKHGLEAPPAVSTVGEVLKRHGLVAERRRRGAVFKVERGSRTVPERPNHVIGVDFKGWFETRDGRRCDPLTVTDLFSRFILKIDALEETRTSFVKAAFRSLFRRQGIPEIIRVDNGAPFASQGPGGLSRLSVWWIGLGIEVRNSPRESPQKIQHQAEKARHQAHPRRSIRARRNRRARRRGNYPHQTQRTPHPHPPRRIEPTRPGNPTPWLLLRGSPG
jgi:putative transposase